MVLRHVVPLELVVGGPARDDLLVVQRPWPEPDPALRDVLVRADLAVRVGGAHVQGDEALTTVHGVHLSQMEIAHHLYIYGRRALHPRRVLQAANQYCAVPA